jgi:amino acid adenylation domain-containing protein
MVACVFAILKVGAFYVPIDPGLPETRINLLLNDVNATVALTQQDFKARFNCSSNLEVIAVDHLPEIKNNESYDLVTVKPDDLGYVIYTSGTTGRPKGVMIEHAAAMNTIADINRRFNVGSDDVIFGVSAFNFDLSVYDIFGAAAVGATLVYPNQSKGGSLDVQHWLDSVLANGVTIWNSVPALMNLLSEEAIKKEVTIPSLRLVMLSGDKVPINLPRMIAQVAPNACIVSLGGATEASIWSIFYQIDAGEKFDTLVPYGYALGNQSWYVKDRYNNDVPDHVIGELMIGGKGLARGYWNDKDKTENSFVVDAQTGQRLYKTGDLGRFLPNGCLEILGRKDFQVKIQGHRIELGEIEATLLERADITKAVVCVGKLNQSKADQLIAYIIAKEGCEIDPKEVQEDLQKTLPGYMIPAILMQLDSLPFSSNGKVDRKELLRATINTDKGEGLEGLEYKAPQNAFEQDLVEIWQRILKLSRIGVDDDFFELGGQSFDAIRIFSEIKDKYNRLFTLGDIWQARTVALFAKKIQQAEGKGEPVSLIELAKNKNGRGIYLLHPAGGTVSPYMDLAKLAERPVYGWQAQWADSSDSVPFTSVEGIAALYLEQLLKHQPNGPYTLGGWSSGGAIVFEIASMLEQKGEQVDDVLMLDAPIPHEHEDLSVDKLIHWFMDDLALQLPLNLLEDIDFAKLSIEGQLLAAIEVLQSSTKVKLDSSLLLPIYKVFSAVVKAVSCYKPAKANFPVSVVRVTDNIVSEFLDHEALNLPDWGWGYFTDGRVRNKLVPGNHHSFLTGENVENVHPFVTLEFKKSKK